MTAKIPGRELARRLRRRRRGGLRSQQQPDHRRSLHGHRRPELAVLRHLGSSQASVFSSKKIFKFGVIESKMLTSVERGRITPSRAEEKETAMRCDLVRTSALALAFVGSIGLAAAQQQPPPNASAPANAVLVNGALAVPGAPANTDTVPAKFSAHRHAQEDQGHWHDHARPPRILGAFFLL